MNDDLLSELVERARTDSLFRQRARTALRPTLKEYGYDLSEDELRAAESFQNQVKDMSDEELERFLSGEVTAHG